LQRKPCLKYLRLGQVNWIYGSKKNFLFPLMLSNQIQFFDAGRKALRRS
jgi:hypothetical protein